MTEGKDATTVGRAKEWLASRGVPPEQITTVCADMSPAYAKGMGEHFPKAQLVFDCFHVVAGVSSAVDAVRRRERQSFPELLKGEDKLTGEQREHRRRLCRGKLQTGRMVRSHWEAIVAYLRTGVTNGAAEALNGIVQTVKRKSHGFRTFEYFRRMFYLVASRLTFDLPERVPTTHTKSL